MCTNHTRRSESLFNWPTSPVGYVAILMALITGVLHLIASTRAIEMSLVLAVLFVLNGLGFVGGAALYVTRYWKPWLFLVAAIYSVVTVLALFPVQGWSVDAFYVDGELNPIRVLTKAAEVILAICVVYLYAEGTE